MTRIDFYQLTGERLNRDGLVSKLCHKAFAAGHKTLLLAADAGQAEHLDRLLWTSDDDSFLPHDRVEQSDFVTPLLVTHEADPRGERELLINLSHDIPLYFAQFERVIEIVTDDNRENSRAHYSYYKDRGYQLHHHTL